jgi:SAM-dependent methyltransferase
MAEMTLSNPQAAHYDAIIDEYDRHYYDHYSSIYRERFILEPLLGGVDLRGKRVADVACGSGATSLYLARAFEGIQLTGFDVSASACERYRRTVGRPAFEVDLTEAFDRTERFDAAIMMGGLHHCAANVSGALRAIASLLQPGGLLLMFEPNRDYVLEGLRRFWYRHDRYFDATSESALSHDALLATGAGAFEVEQVQYFGGPAFFLVYNSLVFRIPHSIKAIVSPPLMAAETIFNAVPIRSLCSSFVARWTRI